LIDHEAQVNRALLQPLLLVVVAAALSPPPPLPSLSLVSARSRLRGGVEAGQVRPIRPLNSFESP